MISKQDFFRMMTEAGNGYSVDVNKGQLAAYHDALSGYSIELVQQAFGKHLRESEWFPKISQIIALIEGTGKEQSADAWSRVMKEIRQTGSYGEPRVSPAIKEAIERLGGWKHVCSLTFKDLEYKSKDFAEVYQAPTGVGIEHKSTNQQQLTRDRA